MYRFYKNPFLSAGNNSGDNANDDGNGSNNNKEPEEDPALKDLDPEEKARGVPTGPWEIRTHPTENIEAFEGEEATVEAKLWPGSPDEKSLPKVSWTKGDYNTLSSGNKYDIISDPANPKEHKLIFKNPKMNDSGEYNMKVVSGPEGKEEIAKFNLNVGPSRNGNGDGSGDGSGDGKSKLTEEEAAAADFAQNLRKKRGGQKDPNDKRDIWMKLQDAKTSEYEDLGFQHGVQDMKMMLRRMAGIKKRSGKSQKGFAKKLPGHKHYMVGDKITLECEVKDPSKPIVWGLNGKELSPEMKCKIEMDGNIARLVVDAAEIQHDATFTWGVCSFWV